MHAFLRAIAARFGYGQPPVYTDQEFYADVALAGQQGIPRHKVMAKHNIGTYQAFRHKLAAVCRKEQLPVPSPLPPLRRTRQLHYIGRKGLLIPFGILEEAGLARGEVVSVKARGEVVIVEASRV